jgi:hypothetical protein
VQASSIGFPVRLASLYLLPSPFYRFRFAFLPFVFTFFASVSLGRVVGQGRSEVADGRHQRGEIRRRAPQALLPGEFTCLVTEFTCLNADLTCLDGELTSLDAE